MKKLSECSDKSYNLQLLRFIAAIFVIIWHAFPLSTGSTDGDLLLYITDGQLNLGSLAVSIFFCAGGLLISKSMCRIGNAKKFFKARIQRLFPSLFVVIFISAFIMGPILTELQWIEYFKNIQVYKYMLNAILVLQHNLPGVFVDNIYISTFNGSLWTLPVEFLCYIGCFFMWKLDLLKPQKILWTIPIAMIGTGVTYYFLHYIQAYILLEAIRPILLFYMGILFYVERDFIVFSLKGVVFCSIAIIISIPLQTFQIIWIICFPYVLLYLCFVLRQIPKKIGCLGNLSYGIYLCGFPIQQMIVHKMGGKMNPFLNMAISAVLAIISGALLYICVERPLECGRKPHKS